MSPEAFKLSRRFDEAYLYASQLHATQKRKGTDIPYISHLMSVAALVIEAGGSEDAAIAALLHDAVEDQGGLPTLEEIRRRFGERVAGIVEDCTDSFTHPRPPYRERKERYIAHMRQASEESRLVAAADKLHNARSVLAGYRELGEPVFSRFTGGKTGTLWYYRTLVDVFRQAGTNPMVEELDRVVSELESLAEG